MHLPQEDRIPAVDVLGHQGAVAMVVVMSAMREMIETTIVDREELTLGIRFNGVFFIFMY